jgi:Predicted GTPase
MVNALANNSQCNAIHRTIKDQFKHAIVYGRSVKHQPQRVGLAHELADEDIGTWHPSIYFWMISRYKTEADISLVSIVKR